jgi:hypothetical protein
MVQLIMDSFFDKVILTFVFGMVCYFIGKHSTK